MISRQNWPYMLCPIPVVVYPSQIEVLHKSVPKLFFAAGLMILATNVPNWYVAVPTAEQIGLMGVLLLWTLSNPYNIPMKLPLGYKLLYSCSEMSPGFFRLLSKKLLLKTIINKKYNITLIIDNLSNYNKYIIISYDTKYKQNRINLYYNSEVCVCVCVCLCTFYLKTVNGNELILFASWRDNSRLGFKILTKFLWLYVKWLIG